MIQQKNQKLFNQSLNVKFKELRKSNEIIGLRIERGNFTFLSRKIFNVLVYNAQKMRKTGLNSPIENKVNKKYFWIQLNQLAKDAAYESNDTKKLKIHLQELVNIRIIIEDFTQWTSQSLISAFTLVNPLGLNYKGGQIWLGFAFPPEVENLVINPNQYTKLTFFYQSQFRSGVSLALYEICRRYLTNPSKLSIKNCWQWWYQVLTGHSITKKIPEYKIAKRDTFKRAIFEINYITDINVKLIEYKQGKKVTDLQFKIFRSSKYKLNFLDQIANMNIISKFIKFKIM